MAARSGNLSINSDNIFPIIKKWLYSDQDIFYRELISNGCDAITKLKKLDMMGEYTLPDDFKARIDVQIHPEKKTIKITDNGIGMTADEVEEYINQIAFPFANPAVWQVSLTVTLLYPLFFIRVTAVSKILFFVSIALRQKIYLFRKKESTDRRDNSL